jgi:23S rRNA pseudouridine955/2504/2580 synthase
MKSFGRGDAPRNKRGAGPSRAGDDKRGGKPSRPGKSSRGGKPERAFGKPERSSGKPERAFGKPERSFGKPERSSGGPERSFGKPERSSGKPERSFGKRERVSGNSEQFEKTFRGKPERSKSPRAFNEDRPRAPKFARDIGDDRDQRSARPEREAEPAPLPTQVQTVTVTADENGMRVDRFLEARFAGLSFSHIQRVIRKGELRVNGRRADSKDRLETGQAVRIPPLRLDASKAAEGPSAAAQKTRAELKDMTLFEDDDVIVLNKPAGLAVQGGSGTTKHVDQMLEALRDSKGQKPRLVHRLDKETAGCLLIAKTRFAAAAMAKSFRSREARKIYWALVAGVPKPKQGRISTYLAKEEMEDDSIMRVAAHGDEGAMHAVTYYAVVETSANKLAWVSLKPVTGRTHQLRAHMAHIEHPIVGDPKYFSIENWQLPGGLQNRLHLLARRIVIPHPRDGIIDCTAPLPPHMLQSWNLLGLDAKQFDPIEDAPEE